MAIKIISKTVTDKTATGPVKQEEAGAGNVKQMYADEQLEEAEDPEETLHHDKENEVGQGEQGYAVSEAKDKSGAVEKIHDESVAVFQDGLRPHPARVTVEMGATIPTAQYANVRISVGLSMPCNPEDADEAFITVKAWIDDKMQELISEVESDSE